MTNSSFHASFVLDYRDRCRSIHSSVSGITENRSKQSISLLPCRVYLHRGLHFFIEKYVLKAEAEILLNRRARINWETDIPIVAPIQQGNMVFLPAVPFSRLRCLTVGVWNKSGFEIEDAEVEVRIFFGKGLGFSLNNWLSSASLQPDQVSTVLWHEKCKEIHLNVTDKLARPQDLVGTRTVWKNHERNIKPFKIEFADILFTTDSSKEAYLADKEATPISFGRDYKIRLIVYGSNIYRPNITRMHLELNAWNNISLSHDSLSNAFLRLLRRTGHKRLLWLFTRLT
jgi:hypothetical protein